MFVALIIPPSPNLTLNFIDPMPIITMLNLLYVRFFSVSVKIHYSPKKHYVEVPM
jgi:hypothetical protein